MTAFPQALLRDQQRFLQWGEDPPVPVTPELLARVRQETPSLQPVTLGLEPSFGFGDRLGLATPGHVAALRRAGTGIRPIWAQQSIREMARTVRTPQQVMDDATWGLLQSGYDGPQGADADHLKTPEDVDRTAAAGFTFFTLDPSDYVDPKADDYDADSLAAAFHNLQDVPDWRETYLSLGHAKLDNGTLLSFEETALIRATVKYGRAVRHALSLAEHIRTVMGDRPYELELSVDETPQPTTLLEHYVIADQFRRAGCRLISLAPRYQGEFEKGVDFLPGPSGNLTAFERSLSDHAALARELGPYKLSLHSGSDKLSLYPAFARITGGRFHVKTAGTSYLEALRVAAHCAPELFREIVSFSRERYETDRATYHVSATLEGVPAPEAVPDPVTLERLYLERWEDVPAGKGFTEPGRQLLHTTFGSVLQHPRLGVELRQVLAAHPAEYAAVLEEHFARHLEALAQGL